MTIQTRTKAWKYDGKGSVEWKMVEPNVDTSGNITPLPQPQPDGIQTLFTHYVRDPDGQVGSLTLDTDFTASARQRVSTFYRDGVDRVFTTRLQNKLGHVTHIATHPGLGLIAATQDANGGYSQWTYDTFGRVKRTIPAGAEPKTLTYINPSGSGTNKPPLELHEKGDSTEEIIKQLDLVGNVVHQKLNGRNDGRLVDQDFVYDDAGRLVSRTPEHFDGVAASLVDSWQYDAAGRIKRAARADGRIEQYTYVGASDGLHVNRWDADPSDPLVSTSTMTFDLSKRPKTNTQHAQARDGRPARDLTTQRVYGWFDGVSSIINIDGTLKSYGLDREGRVISLYDPSSDRRGFGYDAFGDQVSETLDSEVRTTYFDDLGRRQTLTNRDGTTTWTWDTGTNGLGLLGKSTSPSGVSNSYSYDGNGQLVDLTETVGGVDYDFTYDPDSYGRIHRVHYPAVKGVRYTARYEYGAHGALGNVFNDATGAALWTLLETSAAGAATNPSGAFPQYQLGTSLIVHYTENTSRPRLLQGIDANNGTAVQSLS